MVTGKFRIDLFFGFHVLQFAGLCAQVLAEKFIAADARLLPSALAIGQAEQNQQCDNPAYDGDAYQHFLRNELHRAITVVDGE
ncbi:hypothetical protein GN109_11390 [Collimonas pratensis]|uniref:hypothetical protein n=1 Tax=Collimonas pratensis TaxID=279113 RepID=UPI00143E00AC|nr:hypothetical protein [Collimonas pratensis]NKI70026.1 hypothetical protein [Collimonas pratensis]